MTPLMWSFMPLVLQKPSPFSSCLGMLDQKVCAEQLSGDCLLDMALLVLGIPKDLQNPLYNSCYYSELLNNV